MSVSLDQVDSIAALAKLTFSHEEKVAFVEQFNQILQYMEKLDELNTEQVEPTYNVLDLHNVTREDKNQPWLSQEEALANAPRSNHGFFSVPKVIG